MSELLQERGGEFLRLRAQKLVLPSEFALLGLGSRLLVAWNAELLATQAFFVARTGAENASQMLDAALPRVGGFRGSDTVGNVACERNVLAFASGSNGQVGVAA